ncbi:Imm1 family immunity protein [Saccharopolyspora sp. 6V]|uniref:Imm1 family immunity protein n=1 Tax=Saccharopolyspora sp. 6V TaxID=2877239 RepID=UPI001CD52C5B|nr:Imm1 family immunity protein [Saccharopolyspora sp. 6V]MCA1195146.1 hypothetical protein [Saccharopolyspora sp. 6V]
MTTSTHPVVTVVFGSEVHSAATSDEVAELLERAFRSPTPVQVYSWDRPCRSYPEHGFDEWPNQQLRISADGVRAVLSLTIVPEDPDEPSGPDVGTWETCGADNEVQLLADLHSPRWYAPGQAVPIDQARAAAEQFIRDPARRPDAVRWQPGEYV